MRICNFKRISLLVLLFVLGAGFNVYAKELSANLVFNTGKAGNIYFTGETAKWDMEYFNNTSNPMSLTVSFEAVGRKYGKIWEETKNFELASWDSKEDSLIIDMEKEIGVYDIYDLTVILSDGTDSKTITNEFSYIKTGTRNESFGVNTHFGGHYYAGAVDKAIPLIKNSGISIVRDDGASWSGYEQEKGVYGFIDEFKDVPDKLRAEGIDLLTILAYGNTLYTETTSHFPETDAEIKAFVNYAKDVVERLEGKHNYFELWNEPNIKGGFNATGSGGDVYAKLVKAVYPAVKSTNKDAYLMGLSLSGNPTVLSYSNYNFVKKAMENGAGNNLDAVSWHPYAEWGTWLGAGNQVPESFLPNWFSTFKSLCSGYAAKDIWTTEQGYTTQYENSEEQRAEYLVRSYALQMEEGVDKFFWYELINEPVATSGEEDSGWGILRNVNYKTPLAAKPSFLAVSAMNAKLANAEFADKQVSGNFYKYNFVKRDETEVFLVWSKSGEITQDIDFGNPYILKTDMYGNEEILKSETGIYSVTATTEPAYYEPITDGDENFRYVYDVNTGVCSIYGKIESETKDVPISLVLYKPDMSYIDADAEDSTNAVSYFDQIITEENGYFSYKFTPQGPEGIYTLVLSSYDGDERSYDLRLMSELYSKVIIKDKTVDEIKAGDSFAVDVEVIGTNPISKVYNVYVALYNEGRLVSTYAKTDEVMNKMYTKTTHIDIENAPEFDKIKAFVWEKELKPLTNSPEINK